jgi:multisubunit Na+/H+ antiporter MnhB subunit
MMIKRDEVAVLFFSLVALFFILSALLMHPFGQPDDSTMDDYMIRHTQEQTGANNGVTAVVFDYRGFDTLGEATILFAAVAGVIMLFRRVIQ